MSDQKAMTVRLSTEQAALLEAVAEANGVSVADEIRTAVDELIEKRRQDPEFQERLQANLKRYQTILKRLAE